MNFLFIRTVTVLLGTLFAGYSFAQQSEINLRCSWAELSLTGEEEWQYAYTIQSSSGDGVFIKEVSRDGSVVNYEGSVSETKYFGSTFVTKYYDEGITSTKSYRVHRMVEISRLTGEVKIDEVVVSSLSDGGTPTYSGVCEKYEKPKARF